MPPPKLEVSTIMVDSQEWMLKVIQSYQKKSFFLGIKNQECTYRISSHSWKECERRNVKIFYVFKHYSILPMLMPKDVTIKSHFLGHYERVKGLHPLLFVLPIFTVTIIFFLIILILFLFYFLIFDWPKIVVTYFMLLRAFSILLILV